MLFYLMIKNHPFQNGNKRIATTTLLTFLFLNGKWLKASSEEFLVFTRWVAESNRRHAEPVIAAVKIFISDKLVDSPSRD